MARENIKHRIRRYLDMHQGKNVYLEDMVRDLNLEARQIQNTMYRLKGENPDLYIVVDQGRTWRVNEPGEIRTGTMHTDNSSAMTKLAQRALNSQNTITATGDPFNPRFKETLNLPSTKNGKMSDEPRLFDEIGHAHNGDIIVADKENNMYRLIPL